MRRSEQYPLLVMLLFCNGAAPFRCAKTSMKVPPSARYHWCASASQDGNNSPIRVSETADRINEHAVKLVKGGIDLLMADRDFAVFMLSKLLLG